MIKVLSISTDKNLFDQKSPVFFRHKKYSEKLDSLSVIVFTKKGFENKKIDNLYIYPTNSHSKLFYIFDAIKIGNKILRENKDLLITTQDPFETGWVGYFLSSKWKNLFQVQIHTDFLSPYFSKSLLNKIRVSLSSFVIKKANRIRVVSSVIKNSLISLNHNFENKIDVLPIYVDTSFYSRELNNKIHNYIFDKTILMVCRFSKEKRIDLALSVLRKVVDNNQKIGLYLVGKGEEKGNIVRLIKKLKLENNVRIFDWVAGEELLDFYKNSDLFLLTSEYEGYGMTLVEAMASGVPIVTTEVGLAKTNMFVNGQNSYICPVGDINCITERVNELLENNELRKLFKEAMRDNIIKNDISFDNYLNQYVNLLYKIKND